MRQSRTITLHMRFKSWYISWPFSAKQRKKDQILHTGSLENVNDNNYKFLYFYLGLNVLSLYLDGASS